MNRRSVLVIAVAALAVVFFVFTPAITTMTTYPPNQQESFLNATVGIGGVPGWRAYESTSCAFFGHGFGYWQAQPGGNATWAYQSGCPPRIPANAPVFTVVSTFKLTPGDITLRSVTSVNSTTT